MDSAKDAEAYGVFKTLRNRLRKLYPEEVVHYCIQQLNPPGRSFEWTDVKQRPPWFYLVLIKWVVAYGDFLSPQRRNLREKDIDEIFGMLHEIWGMNLPDAYESMYLFFRSQFQQQYWLQENSLVPEMSRQFIFFFDLEPDHVFSIEFRKMHGIELNIFLELSFALIGRFVVGKSHSVEKRFFANLEPSYPPQTISLFLSLLSRDLETLKAELSAMPKRGSVLHEMIEPTPLLHSPLLKINDNYHCYMVHLLFRKMQNFVYDTLRATNANMNANIFVSKFGPIFERYLERGLSYASLKYIPEIELKNRMPRDSKVVDFTILSDDAAILVESKAVQLTELAMLARSTNILAERVKSHILKAIEQGFSVADNLKKLGLIEPLCPVFLLVVTYKDLLLGHGRDFYENVAKEHVNRLCIAYGDIHPIPVDHMFFLSVNDFDLLMEHVQSSCIKLADFLRKAVEGNVSPITERFIFRQHIPNALTHPRYPEYLYAEFSNSGNRLRGRLLANGPQSDPAKREG